MTADESRTPNSFVPNVFFTPNVFVDQVMHLLADPEWKVLSYAVRHCLGWKDKAAERTAAISLTRFENGFTTKDARYFGTGLSRPAIIDALESLVKFGVLEKIGEAGKDGQHWRIPDSDSGVDYDALRARIAAKVKAGQDRTALARQKRTGKSDLPAVSPTNQQRSVPLTRTGKSDLHIKIQANTSQIQSADAGVESEELKKQRTRLRGDLLVLVHKHGFHSAPDKASKGRSGKAVDALLEAYPDVTLAEFQRFVTFWLAKKGSPDFPSGEESLPSCFGPWRYSQPAPKPAQPKADPNCPHCGGSGTDTFIMERPGVAMRALDPSEDLAQYPDHKLFSYECECVRAK